MEVTLTRTVRPGSEVRAGHMVSTTGETIDEGVNPPVKEGSRVRTDRRCRLTRSNPRLHRPVCSRPHAGQSYRGRFPHVPVAAVREGTRTRTARPQGADRGHYRPGLLCHGGNVTVLEANPSRTTRGCPPGRAVALFAAVDGLRHRFPKGVRGKVM